MRFPTLPMALICTLGGVLAGCTFPSQTSMIPRSQVGVARTVSLGTVLSSEPVTIEGQRTNLGSGGGAGLGGAAAASGRGGIVATAVGAVAGAVVGQAVEEASTRKEGQRMIIAMDDGRTVEIIQSAEDGAYREGDRVQVAEGNGSSTVTLAIGIPRETAGQAPAWYERESGQR